MVFLSSSIRLEGLNYNSNSIIIKIVLNNYFELKKVKFKKVYGEIECSVHNLKVGQRAASAARWPTLKKTHQLLRGKLLINGKNMTEIDTQSQPSPKKKNKQFQIQNNAKLQQKKFEKISSLSLLFYLQEFIANWLTKLSVRPTRVGIICSVTIYLVAVCSTIQKREGDRWLSVLLKAKLPGYTTLYHDSSWETFRNLTCNDINTFSVLQKNKNVTELNQHAFCNDKDSPDKNIKLTRLTVPLSSPPTRAPQTLLGSMHPKGGASPEGLTRPLGGYEPEGLPAQTKVGSPEGKSLNIDEGLKNFGVFTQMSRPFFSGANRSYTNSTLGFLDLYKDKAVIYLRSPWEKQIRKDFVGFFPGRSFIKNSDTTANFTNSISEKNCITLPWFRIDAQNQPGRVIIPKWYKKKDNNIFKLENFSKEKDAKDNTFSAVFDVTQPFSQSFFSDNNIEMLTLSPLSDRRQRSRLCSLVEAKRLRVVRKENNIAKNNSFRDIVSNNYSPTERIFGLEYILPFQTNKKRIYAENDSIPFKIESPYFLNRFLTDKGQKCNNSKKINLSDILSRPLLTRLSKCTPLKVRSSPLNLNKQKDQFFTNNNKLFSGRNFYSFQEECKNLFYLYGFIPPTHLTKLVDKTLSESIMKQQHLNGPKNSSPSKNFKDFKSHLDPHKKDVPMKEEVGQNQSNLREKAQIDSPVENIFNKHQEVDLTENRESSTQFRTDSLLRSKSTNKVKVFGENQTVHNEFITFILKNSHLGECSQSVSFLKNKKEEKVVEPNITNSSQRNDPVRDSNSNFYVETLLDSFYNSIEKLSDVKSNGIGLSPNVLDSPSNCSDNRCVEDLSSSNNYLQISPSFVLNNWPLLANASNFHSSKNSTIDNKFSKNDTVLVRLMSGYKFPDYTKDEISCFFRKFVLPKLFLSFSVQFSHSYLVNQVALQPLYIKLPPTLPLFFFKNLAASLACYNNLNLTENQNLERSSLGRVSFANSHFWLNDDAGLESSLSRSSFMNHIVCKESQSVADEVNNVPKKSHLNVQYKRICLQELKTVKDVFAKLGRSYQDYLSIPKESAPAIRISASLEDDKALKLESDHKEKRDDEKSTAFERLEKLRRKEQKMESAKQIRTFAYKHKYAFSRNNNTDTETARFAQNTKSHLSEQQLKGLFLHTQNNPWLASRYGSQNLCSDRKQSFFGRKQILTKRLVAQEQKEITDQVLKPSYQSSYQQNNFQHLRPQGELTTPLFSYKKLQRRARKGLIKLLGSPDILALNETGSQNRTKKISYALSGKVIKSAYSHLRWQKKRFRSRMLGAPCERHLIMPEISANEWRKVLEWQIRNYLFLEKKRLQPLVQENPEKTFKIRQLYIYLPWVTVRTPSNQPFQWPLTRCDYAMSADHSWTTNQKISSKPTFETPARHCNSIDGVNNTSLNVLKDVRCTLPFYKSVEYWDSGKRVSLSLPDSIFVDRIAEPKIQKGNRKSHRTGPFNRGKITPFNGVRMQVFNEVFLCEALTNQSWLLIYRLFLALTLKHILKYVYRVSLKDFIIKLANSDFGLMMTSPEFRDWLEHEPPKLFYKPNKRLQDIAAIEEGIPTCSEIIWYLRNSGLTSGLPPGRAGAGGSGPEGSRGLLLVGPAGTEKTSLVQAIAGECNVPVVVQSMSALALTYQEPYERLENVFTLARQQAPCVLFLDDLDVIGKARPHVVTNDVGTDDLLLSLDTYTVEGQLNLAHLSESLNTNLISHSGQQKRKNCLDSAFNPASTHPLCAPNLELIGQEKEEYNDFVTNKNSLSQPQLTTADSADGGSVDQPNQDFQARRLHLLLRLLTEMDGIAPLNGVVVIATSEQPATLDPALLRAGRFDQQIHLSLPNEKRRIQLFKLSTQKIGCAQSIPWQYFGVRTNNMSGADILSAINHSAIRAIIDNTVHTVETLEHGLNCISGNLPQKLFPIERSRVDPFKESRLAFYQAGKSVVHTLLLDHPELGFCTTDQLEMSQNNRAIVSNTSRESLQIYITDCTKTRSSVKVDRKFRSTLKEDQIKNLTRFESKSDRQSRQNRRTFSARTRIQLETRLIGLYAGKAAELLHLSSNSVTGFKGKQNFLNDTLSKTTLGYNSRSNFVNENKRLNWLWQSNCGANELFTASRLIDLMIDRWYLYSQKIFTYKINRILVSLNHEQFKDSTFFAIAERLSRQLEFDRIQPVFWGITAETNQKVLQTQIATQGITTQLSTNKQSYQNRIQTHWWQGKICQALEKSERPFGKWYRIYLPKIEEREHNEEWVPPDSVVHQSLRLSNLTVAQSTNNSKLTRCDSEPKSNLISIWYNNNTSLPQLRSLQFIKLRLKNTSRQIQRVPPLKTFNDLYLFERDLAYQNVATNCFYTAFSVLNENRELLDLFADHLIRFKILRSHEISKMFSFFL